MACNQITTGGSIALVPGTLDGSFCHKSWQKTYEDFITATSASFTSGAVFAAGSEAPSVDSTVWFKQDTDSAADPCNAMGWHWKKSGTWTPVPVPEAALPAVSGLPTTQTGSSTKNARITVDGYGRVTALDEVDPTAESTDGHAKAWIKFQHSEIGSLPDAKKYNISSVSTTGTGFYSITTADGLFDNVCVCVGSHKGFGTDEAQSTASYTGADHVRVISTTTNGSGAGIISIELPRMHNDGADSDGDVTWDNDKGDAPTDGVHLVMFGN